MQEIIIWHDAEQEYPQLTIQELSDEDVAQMRDGDDDDYPYERLMISRPLLLQFKEHSDHLLPDKFCEGYCVGVGIGFVDPETGEVDHTETGYFELVDDDDEYNLDMVRRWAYLPIGE